MGENISTAAQPDSDRFTRRGVMRATAIGIGATATVGGIGSTSVAAQDAKDYVYTAGAYALGGPAAGAVVAYGLLVDDPDDEEVADSLEWQVHVDEFTRAREDELTLDQTLASLERDVQLVENKAREEAIFRIYEQAVDSGSESDAEEAAEEAIDEAYATVEKALLETWNLRYNRAESVAQIAQDNFSDAYGIQTPMLDLMFDGEVVDNSDDEYAEDRSITNLAEDVEHTLYNGESYTFRAGSSSSLGDGKVVSYDPTRPEPSSGIDTITRAVVAEPDPDDYDVDESPPDVDYERANLLYTKPFHDIMAALDDERDTMLDEVPDMIDSYYGPAEDGEIDLTDIQGPAYLTDAADDAENFQEAALALRAMGFALATEASIVSVEVDGETSEFEGRLAQSVDDPNPLTVGSEIDPENVPGSIYGAFNQENDDGETAGEIVEITEPFTIEETEEGSDEIAFENRELVESDSELSSEEIQELFAENQEARDDARDYVYESATSGGGGGGGFLEDSDQNWGLIAAGAGAVALGWGYISGDGS